MMLCLQVNFDTSTVKNAEAVLIENEQALVHCNKVKRDVCLLGQPLKGLVLM